MFDIDSIVRPNIRSMAPYASARHEFTGQASVFLDANENPYGSPLQQAFNRYPDTLQFALKREISKLKNVPAENVFVGNGSDEAIDLLLRLFCEPGKHEVLICPPTYGMYEVSAALNNVGVVRINLLAGYALDTPALLQPRPNARLLFVCSPNNPTGNAYSWQVLEPLLQNFNGLVVVDEAYIDYSAQASATQLIGAYSNLVVLQTFSKAWGLAGLRLGMAFADSRIIAYLNKVKPPYNISEPTQQLALQALQNTAWVQQHCQQTIRERALLSQQLQHLPIVKQVHPSDANFLLVQFEDAPAVYNYLVTKGIIVRDRSRVTGCNNCLRITIGTETENQTLLTALKNFKA